MRQSESCVISGRSFSIKGHDLKYFTEGHYWDIVSAGENKSQEHSGKVKFSSVFADMVINFYTLQ